MKYTTRAENAKCVCDTTAIAAHISAAATLEGHCNISQAACDELLTALAQNHAGPIMLDSSDVTAHLIAYLAHSLHQNWPWRRFSNLILVTNDPTKRVGALMALDTLLPLIWRLGYTETLTKYAIRYPNGDYFCNRRYKQVVAAEGDASQQQKALRFKASTYENRFILTSCPPELSEKICVTKCPRHCIDAVGCGYRDFLTELKSGAYPIQFYTPQYYIRELIRWQDGKRSRLPQHRTVIILDNVNTYTPLLRAAGRKELHPKSFYGFLLDCERLCGTKKSLKASVRTLTGKLRSRFEKIMHCLHDGDETEMVQHLICDLITGMKILERKCQTMFRDNPRMKARYNETVQLLELFSSSHLQLELGPQGHIVGVQNKSYDVHCLQNVFFTKGIGAIQYNI